MSINIDKRLPLQVRVSSIGRSADQLFTTGYASLQNGQFPDAFLAFYPLCQQGSESNPSALFNLALCYIHAESFDDAAICLERAIASVGGRCAAPFMKLKSTAAYQNLIKKERYSDCYKAPMCKDTPAMFPNLARDRMLRLLVDIFVICERWPEAHRLAEGLSASEYQNIRKALVLSEKHLSAQAGQDPK